MIINNPQDIAPYIDHTLLKADARQDEIVTLCVEARKYQFAAVCTNPYFVPLVRDLLKNSSVAVCTVIDFPLGACSREIKAAGAIKAVADGATEIDMVINLSMVKGKNFSAVEQDIRYVRQAIPEDVILKVILETCYLSPKEIKTCSELALSARADFIKTSTGFGPAGATIEAIQIMKDVAGESMGVKASGGIRDFQTAKKMLEFGATRIGASASLTIIGVTEP